MSAFDPLVTFRPPYARETVTVPLSEAIARGVELTLDRCAAIEAATGRGRCEDLRRPDVMWQRDTAGNRQEESA